MRRSTLQGLTIAVPTAFFGLVVYLAVYNAHEFVRSWSTFALAVLAIAAGAALFSRWVFRTIAGHEEAMVRRQRELETLHETALTLTAPGDLRVALGGVLTSIVDLVGAEGGAVLRARHTTGAYEAVAHVGLPPETVGAWGGAMLAAWLDARRGATAGRTTVQQWSLDGEAAWSSFVGGGLTTAAGVDIVAGGRHRGVLLLFGRGRATFAPSAETVLLTLARQVGIALENAANLREAQRRREEAEALAKIGREISALLDTKQVLHSVVDKARELLGTDTAVLCLPRDDGRTIEARALAGPGEAFAPDGSGRLWQTVSGDVLERCGPVIQSFDDAPANDDPTCGHLSAPFFQAHMAVPLRRGDQAVGALCVGTKTSRVFVEEEVNLLTGLAAQAAIALENARLYEQVQGMAILEERLRIGREMHDGLAQALAYLLLKIRAAQDAVHTSRAADAERELSAMHEAAETAYDEVRQAISGLRTRLEQGPGLIPVLTEYVRTFHDQSGIRVHLEIGHEAATRLAPAAEVQVIRIVQEALTNVWKHARASTARVRFALDGGRARVTVADDGVGFDLAEQPARAQLHYGLHTMRERAESVGGQFAIASDRGRGTTVSVWLPLAP